jgi:hypothetical protein
MIKTLVSYFINNIELEDCLFILGLSTIAYLFMRIILQLNCGFLLSQF